MRTDIIPQIQVKNLFDTLNMLFALDQMCIRDSDLTLEEWTFAGKATFFEEVYGLKAILERVSE